ncbi:hypothetical protein V8G54_031896, partial [Vigna mungo]
MLQVHLNTQFLVRMYLQFSVRIYFSGSLFPPNATIGFSISFKQYFSGLHFLQTPLSGSVFLETPLSGSLFNEIVFDFSLTAKPSTRSQRTHATTPSSSILSSSTSLSAQKHPPAPSGT